MHSDVLERILLEIGVCDTICAVDGKDVRVVGSDIDWILYGKSGVYCAGDGDESGDEGFEAEEYVRYP